MYVLVLNTCYCLWQCSKIIAYTVGEYLDNIRSQARRVTIKIMALYRARGAQVYGDETPFDVTAHSLG